jgi:hypothetical protein
VTDLVLGPSDPTTPNWQRHQAFHQSGLGCSRFARRYSGSHMLFSFPVGTEMFQFPTFPLPVLCVHTGVIPHDGYRVSPFGHPRIKAFSTAPRGFSQPDTSFIGSRRQGIHRWPFVTWKNKDARARYAVLKERPAGSRPAQNSTQPRPCGRGRVGAPSKQNRERMSASTGSSPAVCW